MNAASLRARRDAQYVATTDADVRRAFGAAYENLTQLTTPPARAGATGLVRRLGRFSEVVVLLSAVGWVLR